MEIKRAGSQPSTKASPDWFTGTVRIDPIIQAPAPALIQSAAVTFEPGARTAWHTHPLGQTLIVTAGCGWVQLAGSPIEEIRPGDVVGISPGEKHWHGATPTTAVTHIAIQEKLDGRVVDWLEHVTDEQYQSKIRDKDPHSGIVEGGSTAHVEVQFAPEIEKELNDLALQSGRAPAELVRDAVAGYMSRVVETRDMLNSRYDDIACGKVKLIDGEEAFARLHDRIEARRNSPA